MSARTFLAALTLLAVVGAVFMGLAWLASPGGAW